VEFVKQRILGDTTNWCPKRTVRLSNGH